MSLHNIPPEHLKFLKSVKPKRPKTVIDHILKHGFITTEDLKETYGYNHPPRAVRDVRELGIPLEMYRVDGSDGRKIAAYKFGDFKQFGIRKISGRTALSKEIKDKLIKKYGQKCFIYNEEMNERELQIDHRIPFEIAGDSEDKNYDDFMLLSPSANRAKSWSCENCSNWKDDKEVEICKSCYWAFPEKYSHIALREIRRVDLLWQGEKEVSIYENLLREAQSSNKQVNEFIKDILNRLDLDQS